MLRWQLMWTPVVLAAFLIGLPHGAIGVATGYAAANWLAIGFGFAYCFSGTRFSLSDALRPAVSPLMCTLVACTLANLGGGLFFPDLTAGPARLFVRLSLALVCYTAITPWCVPLANEAVRNVLHRLERARDPQTARQAGGTVT